MATAASHIRAVEDSSDIEQLHSVLQKQRAAIRREGTPDYNKRMAALARLREAIVEQQYEMADAICADFGNRSRHETIIAEVMTAVHEIDFSRKKLKKWMKPQNRFADANFLPARVRTVWQPKGIIGVIAPWNYPVQLGLLPIIGAIAAGNRCMLKPSEFTPRAGEFLKKFLGELFPEDYVAVLLGGPDVSAAFSGLPVDHLVFTGSTRVGKLVMQAASKNLVPVTLELGGKSPAIVGYDFPVEKTARRMMNGKLFNAGQTCIAPDYVMIPDARRDEFVAAAKEAINDMYPRFDGNADYTTIINDQQFERLNAHVEDARAKGAEIVTASGEKPNPATRAMPLTIILDPTEDMTVMQEEIFGPVLPVMTYKAIDDAIEYVNDQDRPLALYYFGDSKTERERVLAETISGGVTVNGTLFHQPQSAYPFGGIGPSGMGGYHGHHSFTTFSHQKGVFFTPKLTALDKLQAPYGKFVEFVMKLIVGTPKK